MAGGGKMNAWDIVNKTLDRLPSAAEALLWVLLAVAAVVIVIGFCKYGLDFIKHGFKQNMIDELTSKLATKEDISLINARIQTIETNHFGHLKNFLTELTSILLDRGIINNENKARLDNELRGM
jgi:hypothetical protein